jgi:hypothetical protein
MASGREESTHIRRRKVMTVSASEPVAGVEVDEPPTASDVGLIEDWVLPLDDFEDGEVLRFRAKFLGLSTSEQLQHRNHEPGAAYARPGIRCGACRWFEPRLFREDRGARRYLLYLTGQTIVPREDIRYRYEWLTSATDVIGQLLTHRGSGPGTLSPPALKMLAEAIGHDDELQEAYQTWQEWEQRR